MQVAGMETRVTPFPSLRSQDISLRLWYNKSMKKIDLAYLAGIIDGEGCIFLSSRNVVEVSVSNTSLWLCNYLKFVFTGSVIKVKEDARGNRQQLYHWSVKCQRAHLCLKLLLPYLRIKKPQAELAIQVLRGQMGRRGKNKTEAQKAIEEANFILLKEYKRNVM